MAAGTQLAWEHINKVSEEMEKSMAQNAESAARADHTLHTFACVEGIMDTGASITYEEVQARMGDGAWYRGCSTWYSENTEPTIDGMLGGLSYIHPEESAWSVRTLKDLASRGIIKTSTALDCGGGIGRVSTYVLKPTVDTVDMVEACQSFVDASRKNFAKAAIRNRFCCRLEDIEMLSRQLDGCVYDIVFLQWVIGHLTDGDLLAFLHYAKKLLVRDTGVLILKENIVIDDGPFFFDTSDMNVIRTRSMLLSLFEMAKYEVCQELSQSSWPTNLYPIRFYVLRPLPG